MSIDRNLEPLVREALGRSVSAEEDRFEAAVLALTATDQLASAALSLSLSIDQAALLVINETADPSDERLEYLAHGFASSEQWSGIDEEEALRFLTALARNKPLFDVLPPAKVLIDSLAIGGWLLAAFRVEGAPDWTDFLDGILESLESATPQ